MKRRLFIQIAGSTGWSLLDGSLGRAVSALAGEAAPAPMSLPLLTDEYGYAMGRVLLPSDQRCIGVFQKLLHQCERCAGILGPDHAITPKNVAYMRYLLLENARELFLKLNFLKCFGDRMGDHRAWLMENGFNGRDNELHNFDPENVEAFYERFGIKSLPAIAELPNAQGEFLRACGDPQSFDRYVASLQDRVFACLENMQLMQGCSRSLKPGDLYVRFGERAAGIPTIHIPDIHDIALDRGDFGLLLEIDFLNEHRFYPGFNPVRPDYLRMLERFEGSSLNRLAQLCNWDGEFFNGGLPVRGYRPFSGEEQALRAHWSESRFGPLAKENGIFSFDILEIPSFPPRDIARLIDNHGPALRWNMHAVEQPDIAPLFQSAAVTFREMDLPDGAAAYRLTLHRPADGRHWDRNLLRAVFRQAFSAATRISFSADGHKIWFTGIGGDADVPLIVQGAAARDEAMLDRLARLNAAAHGTPAP